MTGKSKGKDERLFHLTCGSHTCGQAPRLPEGSEAFQMRGHEVGGAPWGRRKLCWRRRSDRIATPYSDVSAQRKPRRGGTPFWRTDVRRFWIPAFAGMTSAMARA